MFGLESLIGPLLFKLMAGLVVIGGLFAAYFGIKAKGKSEAKAEITQQLQKEREAVQGKVDAARGEDAKIDQKVKEEIKKLEEEKMPTPPASSYKPGDVFKFALLPLVLSLLLGCASFTGVTPVKIDIPTAPDLIDCAPPPSPVGAVVDVGGKNMVLIPLPDAMQIQQYFREAPNCFRVRELTLNAYVDKLVNRLKALEK